MKVIYGALCVVALLLYCGQLVSVANLRLAQRLGLQESPVHSDPIFGHLELWTARWDLWILWMLPAAGILMLIDHWSWPYAAMISGGAFVDAGGREAFKVLGLTEQGVRVGSRGEFLLAMTVYAYLVAAGSLSIGIGLLEAL